MQPSASYLFVYGTLMSAFNNPMARQLQHNATLCGRAKTGGLLFDVGQYPAMTPTELPQQWVFGELWQLPPNSKPLLTLLDEYEGCSPRYRKPHLYIRETVPALSETGNFLIDAWTYIYNRKVNKLTLIASGDYLLYLCNLR